MSRGLWPESEPLRRAIRWIGEHRQGRPAPETHAETTALIDEASRRFDLTPSEEEFLYRALTVKV